MDCTIVQNVRHGAQKVTNWLQSVTGLTSTIVDTERNLSTTVDNTPLPSRSSANSLETGRLMTREFLSNFSKMGGVATPYNY